MITKKKEGNDEEAMMREIKEVIEGQIGSNYF